ncbi:hypothetical protein [Myxococcus sp. SDU36]
MNAGEQCDDGNVAPGDGCGASYVCTPGLLPLGRLR